MRDELAFKIRAAHIYPEPGLSAVALERQVFSFRDKPRIELIIDENYDRDVGLETFEDAETRRLRSVVINVSIGLLWEIVRGGFPRSDFPQVDVI